MTRSVDAVPQHLLDYARQRIAAEQVDAAELLGYRKAIGVPSLFTKTEADEETKSKPPIQIID